MTLHPQVGLRTFIRDAFALNEQVAEAFASGTSQEKPLLDDELESLVRQAFADDAKVINSLNGNKTFNKSRLRIWRSEHNRGLWDEKVRWYSFRYGPAGIPINRNERPLSEELIAAMILTARVDDPRKQDAAEYVASQIKEEPNASIGT